MNIKGYSIASVIICIFIIGACQPNVQILTGFTVEAAPEWDKLFKRDSGWFGGDGIFAIPLTAIEHRQANDQDSTIILFSDTMIGEIKEDSLLPGYRMVNNSIALLKGNSPEEDKIQFHVLRTDSLDQALFVPDVPDAAENQYYWFGKTHIFAYLVENHPEYEVFGFDVEGGALINIPSGSTFPFEDSYQTKLPFFFKHAKQLFGSFGAGVLVNLKEAGAPNPDGYIYVYGVNDPGKQLIVARVKAALFEDFDTWTFWDGNDWSSDYTQCAAITDKVSNELSISFLPDGQIILVSQVGDLKKSNVGIRVGKSLVGPFGPIQKIWDCEEALEEPEFFAYNAKAHPSLSKPGELLISYNVNSFAFWDQIDDYPNLYRPRFIKMIFNQ
jgi:hypothetical protein